MKWTYFLGAAALAAYLLISLGAPILPVMLGTGLAALLNWRSLHKSRAASGSQGPGRPL